MKSNLASYKVGVQWTEIRSAWQLLVKTSHETVTEIHKWFGKRERLWLGHRAHKVTAGPVIPTFRLSHCDFRKYDWAGCQAMVWIRYVLAGHSALGCGWYILRCRGGMVHPLHPHQGQPCRACGNMIYEICNTCLWGRNNGFRTCITQMFCFEIHCVLSG